MIFGTLLLWTAALWMGCKGDDKAACESGDTACDTGEEVTDPYEGLIYVERVSWDCEETRYWYDVATVGWTGGGTLTIVDPGDGTTESWVEEHDLTHWAIDEYGYWEELYLELDVLQEPECSREADGENPCWQLQEPGVSTLALCDVETKERLSFSVSIQDPDDLTLQVDCVAWGADPSQFAGCTAFDAE